MCENMLVNVCIDAQAFSMRAKLSHQSVPLCAQSSPRTALCDESEDGRRREEKIYAHDRRNGQTKECMCVCVSTSGLCWSHVSVYLFQLSACSLREVHTRVKWLLDNRVNGDRSIGRAGKAPVHVG